jgi:hypothetical protein
MEQEKLFELTKENAIARLHQAISETLDDLNFDNFIEYHFSDPRDTSFENELENFIESSAEQKIDTMVDFIKSELWILEDAIWDIIKEETID